MPLVRRSVASPIGVLTLVATGQALAAILWETERPGRVRLGPADADDGHPVLQRAASELDEYFAGRRRRFSVPLDPAGTAFQRAVWSALTAIPYGEVRTYGAIARAVGHPTAFRAVGAANGRNPIAIITPCHRVIGASGALTGFAGGLAVKTRLLALERETVAADARAATAAPGPLSPGPAAARR